MSDYCIILTTFESEEQATPLLADLIEKKQAACVQVFPIKSRYYWDNKVCCDKEVLVLIKTREELYQLVKSEIEKRHPYEVPEILKIHIDDGNRAYLDWLHEVTSHATDNA